MYFKYRLIPLGDSGGNKKRCSGGCVPHAGSSKWEWSAAESIGNTIRVRGGATLIQIEPSKINGSKSGLTEGH